MNTNSNFSQNKLNQLRKFRNEWSKAGSPIAFAGISKIYEYYRKKGTPLSQIQIKKVLSSIPTYTKFKEYHLPRFWSPFFIYTIHQQWQLDICYVSELESYNNKIKYLLVVIECFSRKIFVSPMTDKTTNSTVKKFSDIHKHVGHTPQTIYMDRGCEFNSTSFKNYCKEYNIKPIFSNNSTKAAICERAQRTLQGIMYRYMNQFQTQRYINKLPDIVRSFNLKVNRSIGMCPQDAYESKNHSEVLKNHEKRYRKILRKRKKPMYKLNDIVRILKFSQNGLKERSYKPKYSEERFRISRVDQRLPFPRYFLTDMMGEPILGSFRSYELSITSDNNQS